MKKIVIVLIILGIIVIIGCSKVFLDKVNANNTSNDTSENESDNKECAKEGEVDLSYGAFGECCEGLTPKLMYGKENGECIPLSCGHVCVKCPDSICGIGEDSCNCPKDCSNKAPEGYCG